ncbi:hypothetical protein NQ176_g10376 [Zarea fungicola]|uniref:Uncharacterized protein n=1 Tax=Zarea fungicola TaxID=93591 RepID=A0ACC1MG34_9HYPO|nr:hypothetical protein NQ176_g10376 [Lecanicillium fungicola]
MRTYTEEDITTALDAIKNGHLTEAESAKRYGIPRQTIVGRLRAKKARKAAHAPFQRLSIDAERDLCGWIFTQDRIGNPPTHGQVREMAERLANSTGGAHKPIGKNWLTGFLHRNPAVKNWGSKLRRLPAVVLVETTDDTLSQRPEREEDASGENLFSDKVFSLNASG